MLTAMVAMDLIETEKDRYTNSPLAETFLVRGKPTFFGDMILMQGTRLYNMWGKLDEAVKNNVPPKDVFDNLQQDNEVAKAFVSAMHNNSIGPAKALAEKIDFSKYNQLLDVGGGSGSYPIILAGQFQNLKAIIFDYKAVCEIAEQFIQSSGLQQRISTTSGDVLFDDLPRGCDVALLAQVIHSYSPDDCKRILKKIYDALTSNGLLIINEFFLADDKQGPLFPALFSVNMLIESQKGKCYSKAEVTSWLEEIGFEGAQSGDLVGPVGFLTARKA
jgi:3-hydroxy-5-methyl-1-naphthoate 3-O-methyltransferase